MHCTTIQSQSYRLRRVTNSLVRAESWLRILHCLHGLMPAAVDESPSGYDGYTRRDMGSGLHKSMCTVLSVATMNLLLATS